MCLFMMGFLPMDTWIRLAVWTVIGLVIYFAYSIKHAKPSKYQVKNLVQD
jgi:APA family basic amino acid/polyamine antiporter